MTLARLLTPCLLLAQSVVAQETLEPNDIHDERAEARALVHASVTVAPGEIVEDATLLLRDGVVESVRAGGEVPDGYVVIDLTGRRVYPGLVDLDSGYGVPDPDQPKGFSFGEAEVLESTRPGAYNANEAIRSEYRAAEHFTVDDDEATAYRKLGFSVVLSHRADGIARGTGALVTTASSRVHEEILVADATRHLSFDKGSSEQAYPISPMGAVALLRQTYLDARWYAAQQPRPFTDLSLDAWLRNRGLPVIFEVDGWAGLLRADGVGDEFEEQYIIRSGSDLYQRLDAVRQSGAAIILELDFPEAFDVSDPFEADHLAYADLKHWELAPTTPAALAEAGIVFALTSGGASTDFPERLRRAIEHGLDETTALAALTTVPASLLGQEGRVGRLQPGALANLLVTSGPLFAEDTVIEEHWIAGERHRLNPRPSAVAGRYELSVSDGRSWTLEVSGDPRKPEAELLPGGDAEPVPVELKVVEGRVSLGFEPGEGEPALRLAGWIEGDRWTGRGRLGDGRWVDWSARRQGALAASDDEAEETAEPQQNDALGPVIYPFQAYGRKERPKAGELLFRNATLWTNEAEGVLEATDLRVVDGRIAAIGRDLPANGARVVDASGLHLTPGIVDEHSHIALAGVNDIATNSSMVRMSDVVDSEDVDIYRNLAGGVTSAQLLHGSANPIGGQSALVKFRWGALPAEMLIEDADGFIKFALGENVKRSRNDDSIRYPQTRMGVEQVYRDAFSRARDYRSEWAEYESLSRRARARTPAPRRDLAMDAMVEILDSERFITCHSYVQSEINMLMHVAEDFDFRVNTFTHILEGYKVADKMAAHGAGGSTFSDWWAYKWEVRYAIPYNAALMNRAGVTVAINSDSSEMSRRLNQEAAKAVKYGAMSEEEALKLVTLNPAKLLHLDHRLGSLAEDKDADLVLWSDHPLSIYARPKMTLVDGVVQFDEDEDRQLRESMREERARLIARMAEAGGGKSAAGGRPERRFQCDSLHGYEYLDLAR